MAALTVSVTVNDSGCEPCTVVVLAGEVDVTSSGTLRGLLEAETAKRPRLLLLDLSGLRFMDSSALQVILGTHRALAQDGGQLALGSPHDTMARILHLTEADRLMPVYRSVQEATSRQ